MKVIRIIGWALAILAVLYSILAVFAPGVLKTAEVASKLAGGICILGLVSSIFLFNFIRHRYKKGKESKGITISSPEFLLSSLSFSSFSLPSYPAFPTTTIITTGKDGKKQVLLT